MFREILTLFVIITIFLSFPVLANEIDSDIIDITTIETTTSNYNEPKISSKYALILERSTNTVLYQKKRIYKNSYGINY